MKIALKWIGWVLLALLALTALSEADKTTVALFAAAGWVVYMVYGVAKQVESLHKDTTNRLERLYDKVEHVAQEIYALDRKNRSPSRRLGDDDARG